MLFETSFPLYPPLHTHTHTRTHAHTHNDHHTLMYYHAEENTQVNISPTNMV